MARLAERGSGKLHRGVYECSSAFLAPLFTRPEVDRLLQYNAIQALSGNAENYTFGPAWTGPAYKELNPGDQAAAINVFNSAISMDPAPAASNS